MCGWDWSAMKPSGAPRNQSRSNGNPKERIEINADGVDIDDCLLTKAKKQ
jgi:hypothetical protein